ncbi:MAG TPA: transglycosylase SLT domain-containing protein [Smithellaceae bacterium]|nr:transglycosylase SLT domain-containing protein [Smithellaceae bacterium]
MQLKYILPAISAAFFIFSSGVSAQDAVWGENKSVGQALIESIKIDKPPVFCGEAVPWNEAEIKERLERELLYALDSNDNVILWLKRAHRYFPHIEAVLKKNSLPDDLKYIAIAESSLKPLAMSNKGAVGYWQFIEGTGIKYGMEINSEIDERRNFFTSTEAAVAYLKDIHAIFGSWTMAAAAYNMGEEGLKSEILVQKVDSFYQLYLPQETQRYIFRILAAKIIMSNPQKYGYFLAPEDLYQPLQLDQVELTGSDPVPLHLVAAAANTYFKRIKDINPQLKGYYIPPGKRRISIPRDSAVGFHERFDKLLQEWNTEKKNSVYTVKKGDNLSTIAARFNIPVKAIIIWNGINGRKKLTPGDQLIIFSKNLPAESNNGGDSSDEKPAGKLP